MLKKMGARVQVPLSNLAVLGVSKMLRDDYCGRECCVECVARHLYGFAGDFFQFLAAHKSVSNSQFDVFCNV